MSADVERQIEALQRQGQEHLTGLDSLRQGYDLAQRHLPEGHPLRMGITQLLAAAYRESGNLAAAAPLYRWLCQIAQPDAV